MFLLHLALQGMAYVSINNQVSAIVTLAKLNGSDVDIRSDFNIRLTMAGLRRILGDTPSPKDELLPSDLVKMRRFVNPNDFTEWSTWIGVVFLYRSMLRKCHVFSDEFDYNMLARRDIEFTHYGMMVSVSRSKTIQFRERIHEIPISRGGGSLCAVSLLKAYFHEFPTILSAPLLSRFKDGKLIKVTYKKALSFLKTWAKSAGVQKDVGMHSLRRGSATLMSLGGIPIEHIKNRGDWKSSAVLQYLAYPVHQKLSIEEKIVGLLSIY